MVAEFVVASVKYLAAVVDLARLFDGVGAHAEGGSVLEASLLHGRVCLTQAGVCAQLAKVGHRGAGHGRASVVLLAGDAEGLVTVLVELAERLALIRVKRRVLNDFVAEIARVVLEVVGLERRVLLLTASIAVPIGVTLRVVIHNCLRILLHGVMARCRRLKDFSK